jgi:hypothetical protein
MVLMAEQGVNGTAVIIVLCLIGYEIIWAMSPKLKASRDYLKSIDKKMHTHAADGSINGIRGWY